MSSKRPTYQQAVEWIAWQDEPDELDPGNMVDLMSVVLVADLYGVTCEYVAADVVSFRKKVARAVDDVIDKRDASADERLPYTADMYAADRRRRRRDAS